MSTSTSKLPPPLPPSIRERARTQLAPAAVPIPGPAPAVRDAAPVPDEPSVVEAQQRTMDFRALRGTQVGTQLSGAQGLSMPRADAPTLRLAPGVIVPGTRYRIVRWLGEGGMGVVYEAEHLDIERRVALKILRFDLSQQPKMAQVFREEARAASRLGSPNIVEVYDFGGLPDGRLFFCMELLQGSDLVPNTIRDTMDPGELVATLRQVCKGLHAAHQAGVVHRDVKPENIISTIRNGRRGFIKVVDFGISAMLAAGRKDGEAGTVTGTPHYMAPEQILNQEFDGRLDIYAVGCMAYELLVGHPPFDSPNLPELLQAQLEDPPVPPRQARPDAVIPEPVEEVVLRCLAKDPDDRYADMADLEAALCEAQIAAGLHTPWDDLPLPELDDVERRERLLREMPSPIEDFTGRRRRWVWPAVAGISILAAAATGAYALVREPSQEQIDQVDVLVNQAREAAVRSNWVVPPPEQPDVATAYQKVLELEEIDGLAARLGDQTGQRLRSEFSTTLIQYGDQFWPVPDARPIARDWYIYALMFDPDNDKAFERSGLSRGQLAQFAEDVRTGRFRTVDLALSRLMAAAVETDATRREQLEQQAAAADVELSMMGETVLSRFARAAKVDISSRSAPASTNADLEREVEAILLDEEEQARRALESAQDLAEDSPEDVLEVTDDEPPSASPAASSRRKRPTRRAKEPQLETAARDPQRAAELAAQGVAALRAGRRSAAESLFNQAIAHDRANTTALMGLADVYFDLGANQRAVLYAERAVKAAPRTQTYRLKLGDAYFKVLRYRDALTQYEEAQKLGESRAEQRIAKVRAKLGE